MNYVRKKKLVELKKSATRKTVIPRETCGVSDEVKVKVKFK